MRSTAELMSPVHLVRHVPSLQQVHLGVIDVEREEA